MGHKSRRDEAIKIQKMRANVIVEYVLSEVKNDKEKIGVLLCEGDESSIDVAVYSAVFPNLVVVPLGGCCNVMRLLHKVKKMLATESIYAFGIIDRDALSKPEIKRMYNERGVYTTKLPFIENIICAPEIIKIVCEDLKLDYEVTIEKIHEQLMKKLWQKLKEALPINLGIEREERIEILQIGASTKKKKIEKRVNRENILYAYRSKVIIPTVAAEVCMESGDEYYLKVKQMLEDERYHSDLVNVMSKFIPKLELYDFEEILAAKC